MISKWKKHHINKLAHLSHIQVYPAGETVNLSTGGIMISGSLKNHKVQASQYKVLTKAKVRKFAFLPPIRIPIYSVWEETTAVILHFPSELKDHWDDINEDILD
mmetsp:Transcript_34221/g.25279  ORF Transcript_34221/g.25279 Transcript_34221/m.25279 type:complete len:104 (-) Transcript_34221:619-930(-)